MSDVALLIADLVTAGVDPMLIGRVAAALSEHESLIIRDEQADRRRERDRERKRIVRGIPQTSADPSPKTKVPPTPPLKTQPLTYPPSPPTGAHGSTVEVLPFATPIGFARFWEAYPSKVGKRDAEKAYERACGRLRAGGHDPPSVILAGLERAKASRKWGEGFVPNPATWLNQDRWEDQPLDTPNARSSPALEKLRAVDAAMRTAAGNQQRPGGP